MYGEGISKVGNILDVAVDLNIINKSGAWFSYEGERLGQGRDNIKKYMQENPEFAEMIETRVRRSLGLDGSVPEMVEIDESSEEN